jgi:DNA-binding response OmpR family regulator
MVEPDVSEVVENLVLVIEDEADIRGLIALELSIEGYQVDEAGDGETGLDLARDNPPDVIVLDLMLPGIDGWQVLRALKDDPDLAEIPVVVLTARAAEIDRVRGGIEGAVVYLTKPFNPEALVSSIEDVLRGEPEPVRRHAVQQQALAALARLETPSPSEQDSARPRLSRLDGQRPASRPVASVPPAKLSALSPKQRELLDAIGSSPTVREAAEGLGVSRSNVYASLRRITRKLGMRSVGELIVVCRGGGLR